MVICETYVVNIKRGCNNTISCSFYSKLFRLICVSNKERLQELQEDFDYLNSSN
jgi:hypothetical protein